MEGTMERICIISAYIGELPDTFPLWVKSVSANQTVDFMLITDKDVSPPPKNLRVIKKALFEIKRMAEQELDMEVTLETPYKLCDFKPVFGKIFRRYLKDYNYDYWGHCDLDLIFGDLRFFFNKYGLNKYDKFLHQGHLALYRNTERINNAYKLPGSYYYYKQVFTRNESFVFDEYNRINGIFHYNHLPIFEEVIFANINPAFTRFKCCRINNYSKQLFYYEKGKVFRAFINHRGEVEKEEFIYIHLLGRKLDKVPVKVLKSEMFAITEDGYYVLHNQPSVSIIKQYTKNQNRRTEYIEAAANFKKRWLRIPAIKAHLSIALWNYNIPRQIIMKRNYTE